MSCVAWKRIWRGICRLIERLSDGLARYAALINLFSAQAASISTLMSSVNECRSRRTKWNPNAMLSLHATWHSPRPVVI
jgi:hypothetical protein